MSWIEYKNKPRKKKRSVETEHEELGKAFKQIERQIKKNKDGT